MPKLMMGNSAISPATVFNIETVPCYIPLDENYDVDQNGKLISNNNRTSYTTGIGVTDIGNNILQLAFNGNSNIITVEFPEITTISGNYACEKMLRNANNVTTLSFPELVSITGNYALQCLCMAEDSMGSGTSGTGNKITTLTFPKLKSVTGNYGCYQMFGFYGWVEDPSTQGPKLTTINLGALEVASGTRCFSSCFEQLGTVTSCDLHSLKIAGNSSFQSFLAGNNNLAGEFVFDNLIQVGPYAFSNFSQGSKITKFGAPNLTSITDFGVFSSCVDSNATLTEINFNNLTTIDIGSQTVPTYYNGAFSSAFGGTGLTTVSFPKLETIKMPKCFIDTFFNCSNLTSVSFPALKSNAFGSWTNQFNYMLERTNGVTVHFPSNLQSVIGSWSDVTNGFGGTNTTVLFDLPATE